MDDWEEQLEMAELQLLQWVFHILFPVKIQMHRVIDTSA